ncbi:hypothetical protein GCM10027341_09760 [Spirosoma knui]
MRDYVRQLQIVGCSFPDSMAVLPVKPYWPRAENTLTFYPKDHEEIEYGIWSGNPTRQRAFELYEALYRNDPDR